MTPADPVFAEPITGRRPFVSIDGWALKSNWRSLALVGEKARTGAAVKADSYGLGALTASKALFGAGCRDFFVAWAEEGAALREAMPGKNCRIFVLQGFDGQAARLCREHQLVPVLSTPGDIALWRESAGGGLPGPCALQFETGMHRLGLSEEEARKAAALSRDGQIDIALVMSHLASADILYSGQSDEQLERFRQISAPFAYVARSLANSAAIFRGLQYHFDLTRPGIALYAGRDGIEDAGTLRPVVTLRAHVLQIAGVAANEAVGYGATHRVGRPSRIATLGIGYADGYPRSASGSVPGRGTLPGPDVFAAGRRVPVVGRVSMDMTTVDITDLPEDALSPGDTVEMFGANVSVDEVAHRAGTIAYELFTSLGSRVQRRWV